MWISRMDEPPLPLSPPFGPGGAVVEADLFWNVGFETDVICIIGDWIIVWLHPSSQPSVP
jgi:hypothetical protein